MCSFFTYLFNVKHWFQVLNQDPIFSWYLASERWVFQYVNGFSVICEYKLSFSSMCLPHVGWVPHPLASNLIATPALVCPFRIDSTALWLTSKDTTLPKS